MLSLPLCTQGTPALSPLAHPGVCTPVKAIQVPKARLSLLGAFLEVQLGGQIKIILLTRAKATYIRVVFPHGAGVHLNIV